MKGEQSVENGYFWKQIIKKGISHYNHLSVSCMYTVYTMDIWKKWQNYNSTWLMNESKYIIHNDGFY